MNKALQGERSNKASSSAQPLRHPLCLISVSLRGAPEQFWFASICLINAHFLN